MHTYIYVSNNVYRSKTNDVEKAEEVLTKALNLSDTNEVALYNIASLLHKHKVLTYMYVFVYIYTFKCIDTLHLHGICKNICICMYT